MNTFKNVFTFIVISLSLSACNTVYKQQNNCLSMDWFAAGFDAAKRGIDSNLQWENKSQLCVKNNIWVDRQSYDEGYGLGLNSFCTAANGFEFGQRGLSYTEICTRQEQELFNTAYDDGLDLYNINDNIEVYENNLQTSYEIIADTQPRIDRITYIIKNSDLDKKTKKEYFSERNSLRYDRDNAKEDIETLNASIKESHRQLAKLEFTSFEKYYGGNPSSDTFSLDETAFSESLVVAEPAVIIYKPTELTSEIRSHFNKTTKEINLLITEKSLGDFRYQIIGDSDIAFIDNKQETLNVDSNIKADKPILFLWDPIGNLTTISYQNKTPEELLASVEQFLNQQR